MSRKFLTGVLIAAMPIALFAQGLGECGETYGGVELLYWKATHCPIPFAKAARGSSGQLRSHKFFNIKSDYDWGVRGRIGYAKDCFFADIGYLWLQNCDHVKVRRGGFSNLDVQGTETGFDVVTTDLRFRYQNVNLRFGYSLHKCDMSCFHVYGNARWMEIDFHNISRGFNSKDVGRFEQNACFQGGGPGVGVCGNFCVWNRLSAGGRLGVMAMIGRSRVDRAILLDPENGGNHRLFPEGRTCIVPGMEMDLHIGYSRECRCTKIGIVLGYEMDYYVDPLTFATSEENVEGLPMRECQNVGFGGPYVGLWVKY